MKPGFPGHPHPDHPIDDRPRADRLPAGFGFVRTLGTGAGGWVVLARQTAIGRDVAMKMVFTGARSTAASSRLRREGRAIAALDHRNIVRVFDLIAGPKEFWLVMEHVAGSDLATTMRTSTVTAAARVNALTGVAAALEHAHARGVVHRDVKPANVLVGSDGVAKLADFGIARLPAGIDPFRSVDARSWGTPWYMAPEQVEDPSLDSPEIDAYAYALVGYELLVGVGPFVDRDPVAMMRAHLTEEPADPRDRHPSFPGSVARTLLAGLSKDPRRRPTPSAIADQVRRVDRATWDAVVAAHPVGERAAVRTPTVQHLGPSAVPPVERDLDAPSPPAPAVRSTRGRYTKRPIRARVTAWILGAAVGTGAAAAVVELTVRR